MYPNPSHGTSSSSTHATSRTSNTTTTTNASQNSSRDDGHLSNRLTESYLTRLDSELNDYDMKLIIKYCRSNLTGRQGLIQV